MESVMAELWGQYQVVWRIQAEERTRPMEFTGSNYATCINPIVVRNEAVEVAAPLSDGSGWTWEQAAALFDYVKKKVKYVPDPRGVNYVTRPDITLKFGGGDCDDQAVLLASLCEAIGMQTRLVLCENSSGESHLLTEVCLGCSSPEEVSRRLRNFYGNDTLKMGWERDCLGRLWVPGDTAMCRFFGENDPWERNGYIEFNEDRTSWVWTHPVKYFDRLDFGIQELKFYEGPFDTPPVDERVYKRYFWKDDTRYICWEVNFKHLETSTPIEFGYSAFWEFENGKIEVHQKGKVEIQAGWQNSKSFNGWGRAEPGSWKPGKYTVSIYFDSDLLIDKAVGEFTVMG
ncbi:MAG: transglutaminase family protein [Blastocatellia bacterium]|nr:transglutaminase family protein [Blastocatellia bacterium]